MSGKWGGRRAVRLTRAVLAEYGPVCHLYAKGRCLVGSPAIPLDLPPRHPHGPSADHLVPRARGGSDDLANMRPAHRVCNSARGARSLATSTVEDGRAFFKV